MANAFEIVTPAKSKKGKSGLIIAILIVVFLILSVVAGVLLVRQRQNIQEKASVSNMCPAAEACPYAADKYHLWDCHPAEADGTVNDQICQFAGKVGTCGAAHTQYCCPAANGDWTADMTVCNAINATATPTPTVAATATATATPHATATATPTTAPGATLNPNATETPNPTATPTSASTSSNTGNVQTSPRPIPITGTDWPTMFGAGVGVMVIIASVLIAL